MVEGPKATDQSARLTEPKDHPNGHRTSAADHFQQQAGKELSTPGNSIIAGGTSSSDNVFWSRSNPVDSKTKDAELKTLLASMQPITGEQPSRGYGSAQALTRRNNINIDQLPGNGPLAGDAQRKQGDGLAGADKPLNLARLEPGAEGNNPVRREWKLHLNRPLEIKIHGKADYSTTQSLTKAREHFLETFKKHGGRAEEAKTAVDKMIRDQHDLAQYAKEHPSEKVHFVKDKYLAATLNKYSNALDAKRTSGLSQPDFNRKMLGLVKAIADPLTEINQGQIGSCALHAGVKYVIAKRPDLVAGVATKILTTGQYRGQFTKQDMGATSGQTETDHLLGTMMLRATYKTKHLTDRYGGTTAPALAAGIKRLTDNKVHAVWSNDKTKQNGADLDITMGGAHAQYTVTRAKRQNGHLVLMEKTDNTWKGFRDGSWRRAT